MAAKIYGTSDDLIEFEGDVDGEVGCYGTDDAERCDQLSKIVARWDEVVELIKE